ncbi:cell division protein FtsK, partial [Streptomyces sp. NPDC079189]
MNHDDESELFNRLEADMKAAPAPDSGGDVVDLDKARSARSESADPTADRSADPLHTRSAAESGDPTEPVMVDGPAEVGPGFIGRIMGAKRRAIVPLWLLSTAEFKTAARWAAGHYGHLAGYHALRSPYYATRLAFQSPRGAAKFVGG